MWHSCKKFQEVFTDQAVGSRSISRGFMPPHEHYCALVCQPSHGLDCDASDDSSSGTVHRPIPCQVHSTRSREDNTTFQGCECPPSQSALDATRIAAFKRSPIPVDQVKTAHVTSKVSIRPNPIVFFLPCIPKHMPSNLPHHHHTDGPSPAGRQRLQTLHLLPRLRAALHRLILRSAHPTLRKSTARRRAALGCSPVTTDGSRTHAFYVSLPRESQASHRPTGRPWPVCDNDDTCQVHGELCNTCVVEGRECGGGYQDRRYAYDMSGGKGVVLAISPCICICVRMHDSA